MSNLRQYSFNVYSDKKWTFCKSRAPSPHHHKIWWARCPVLRSSSSIVWNPEAVTSSSVMAFLTSDEKVRCQKKTSSCLAFGPAPVLWAWTLYLWRECNIGICFWVCFCLSNVLCKSSMISLWPHGSCMPRSYRWPGPVFDWLLGYGWVMVGLISCCRKDGTHSTFHSLSQQSLLPSRHKRLKTGRGRSARRWWLRRRFSIEPCRNWDSGMDRCIILL